MNIYHRYESNNVMYIILIIDRFRCYVHNHECMLVILLVGTGMYLSMTLLLYLLFMFIVYMIGGRHAHNQLCISPFHSFNWCVFVSVVSYVYITVCI